MYDDISYGPLLDTRMGNYLIRLRGGATVGPFDCDDLAQREALVRWAFDRFGTPPEGYRLDSFGECSALNLTAVRRLVREAGGDTIIGRPPHRRHRQEITLVFYADGRVQQIAI